MKVRHTYPSGQTSASKIKALLLCLEEKKGKKAADAWLAKLRLTRTDLDDETRLLPLSALRDAVKAFSEDLPDALADVGPYLVTQENLGTWARILRGTRTPERSCSSPSDTGGRDARGGLGRRRVGKIVWERGCRQPQGAMRPVQRQRRRRGAKTVTGEPSATNAERGGTRSASANSGP